MCVLEEHVLGEQALDFDGKTVSISRRRESDITDKPVEGWLLQRHPAPQDTNREPLCSGAVLSSFYALGPLALL